MRFGLGLMPLHPPAESGRLAALAEAAGFDAIWVPDERFCRDCYLTLASIAQATRQVRLGPCVTDPYSRHAALTAVAVATLYRALIEAPPSARPRAPCRTGRARS